MLPADYDIASCRVMLRSPFRETRTLELEFYPFPNSSTSILAIVNSLCVRESLLNMLYNYAHVMTNHPEQKYNSLLVNRSIGESGKVYPFTEIMLWFSR